MCGSTGCNPSTQEADTEELQIWGQPGLCDGEPVSKKKEKKIPTGL
jgi:hypothetical protein